MGNGRRGRRLHCRHRDLRITEDYFDTYSTKVRSLSVSNVGEAAKKVVHPISWFGW
jgi:hypothetical protein